MKLVEIMERAVWDEFVYGQAYGHPLQLWGWGEVKRANGWMPHRLGLMEGDVLVAGAQVLTWRVPKLGLVLAYVPRGPVAEPGSKAAVAVLAGLAEWAREQRVLYVRIEPAWTKGVPGKAWVRARHHVQLAETYTIDLGQSEDDILAVMSHKHRQYIRKSERDGVMVARSAGDDLAAMYGLYEETGRRAGFGIHGMDYYEVLQRELGEGSWLYYARVDGRPVAFLWLAAAGGTAYELYGGVNEEGQALKANYLLKWRAIADMKAAGMRIYDFNGRLNEGVSRFKEGFGPVETDYVGTWDLPVRRGLYRVWEHLWPVVKVVGRRLAQLRR